MNAVSSQTYDVTYDNLSGKITVDSSTTPFKFFQNGSTSQKILGLTGDTPSSSSVTFQNPIDLTGVKMVLVTSQNVRSNDVVVAGQESLNILACIPINQETQTVLCSQNYFDSDFIDTESGLVSTIDIQLLDSETLDACMPAQIKKMILNKLSNFATKAKAFGLRSLQVYNKANSGIRDFVRHASTVRDVYNKASAAIVDDTSVPVKVRDYATRGQGAPLADIVKSVTLNILKDNICIRFWDDVAEVYAAFRFLGVDDLLYDFQDVLRSNNAPEQLRNNNETVEKEVFWAEKSKHIHARNPTGFFDQPVFQKYRGFGTVETQFVPNAPTGYLRNAYGRSLNPDTFHRVFSDTDLRRMNAGRVDDRSPKSVQETRYTNFVRVKKGVKMNTWDQTSMLEKTGLGTSGVDIGLDNSMAAKRKGKGPVTETSDIDINIKSSKSIKSEKRIPSPISDTGDQFDTPAWSGSPTPGPPVSPKKSKAAFKSILNRNRSNHLLHPECETRMPESSAEFTRMYQEWYNNGSQPYTSWTNIDWSKKLKRSHSNYMPSKKPQPQEEVVESDESLASTDTEAEDDTQAEQDYVKALVDKYAAAKKPQDGDGEPEPVEKPVKKKRVGTPKQIEHLKGAREKAVIVRKQLAEKRRREEAEQKEKDEQSRIVKEAMRLRELEKESKKAKKQVSKKPKKVIESSSEEEEVIVRKKPKKKKVVYIESSDEEIPAPQHSRPAPAPISKRGSQGFKFQSFMVKMPLPNSVQGQYTVRRNFQVLDNLRAGTVRANNVKGDVVENIDGVFFIRDLITPSEKIHIAQDRGIYEISIDDNTAYDPLFVDDTNTIGLRHDGSLEVVEGELSVVFPPKETLVEPLIRDFDGIKLQHDETMKVTHGMLGIDYQDPLYLNMQQKFSVDYDQSLTVNTEGQLAVVPEFINNTVIVEAPLQRRVEDSHIVLNAGKGLQVNDDGELQTDLNNIIKPLGALHANGLFDLADDFLEYGYEAIDEIFGDGEDTEVKLLRLKTSSDFTQKGLLSGSKVLAIKNKGANRIPYYATISDEFDTDDTFRYNSTLNELHVGHVSLNTNFNPDNNEAVTAGYAEQLYQSETGSPIDVSALSNGRRTLGLRTDATLAVENQVLGVNATTLVNGSSIKVADGKIASGLIFQPANGVRLREGTNNDVQLALEVEGALEKVGLNKIKEVLTFGAGLQRTENAVSMDLKSANSQILVDNETGTLTGNVEAKPNSGLVFNENILDLDKSAIIDGSTITVHNGKLTGNLYHFGDGFSVDTQSNGNNTVALELEGSTHIQVQGNKISTDLKPYTGGQNVTVSNNTISVNIPQETPYSGGPGISVAGKTISNTLNISAGMGITVMGSAATGYIISSQNLKTQDDDDDERKTDNEDDTLKNENNETVQSTSPVSTILPFPLIPFPPPPPVIPLVPIFPFIGLLPTLLVIFGYQRERKKKKNPDGTDMTNSDGTPVFDTTPEGEWIWSEGSNVAIQSDKTTRLTRLLMDDWPEDVRVGYWASVMNLSKTWQFEELISRPWTIETVSSLVEPLDTRLLTAESSIANHGGRLYGAEIALDAVEAKVSILESNSPITVGKGLVKNSNVISINPYQSETLSAIGDVVFGMQRWVPSTVFFTDSEPSTTTVAGEAWGNGTDNVNRSHKAFANWGSSLYFTNLYTGAGAAGVSYKGEWIQIQLPAAKSISATRLRYRDGGNILGMPQTFAILGSNDGASWNLLYHQSTPVGWSDSNRDPKWFTSTNTTAYSFIRLPLFIGNGLTGSNANFTQTITASAAPTIGAHLVNKTFTDATQGYKCRNLINWETGDTQCFFRVTNAESSLAGKQGLLSVSSGITLSNNVLGYDSAIISTKASTDALATRVTNAESSLAGKQGLLSVSSGITLSNNVLGYDSAIISTKASTDALATRVTNAESSITTLQTGKQNSLSVAAGITLTNSVLGYDSAIIATKSSVDALATSKQDVLTAGTGLTKTGATLLVNASQPQITSVGTLTSLAVNGYINITNTGSVALSIADNVSFGRCGANTQWFSNAQTGDAIIRASGSKVIRLGTNINASLVDIFDGGMVLNSGNLTVATAPTLGSLTATNTNVTNLTGRVVSLESGGSTNKEITVWSKIKGSDTVPVPLPPAGGAALTAGTSTPTTWEYLNGTYTLTASSIYSAGYEAYRGFKSERLTAPWVSGNASWIDSNSTFVPGEWIAVDLPAARTISSVTIYQRLGEPSPSMPLRIAVLVGQSTGTMTVAVDQDNIPDVPNHTLNFTAASYKYIRLVLTTTTAGFPLALDHAQVKIASSEDSVSTSSGSLQIAGGVGINRNLFVGGGLNVSNPSTTTSVLAYLNAPSLAAPANVSMQLGVAASLNNNAYWNFTYLGAGSTTNSTNIGLFGGVTALSVSNSTISVTGTGESTSSTTGALQVAGGLSVQKSINIGTGTIPCGITTEVGGSTPLLNVGINYRHTPSLTSGAAALRIDGRGFGTGGTPFFFFTRPPGSSTETPVVTIDMTGRLAVNGGLLNLTNGASNLIHYSTAGVQAPTFSTRSTGTKIVLYPEISGTTVDYSVGVESGHVWHAVPTTGSSTGFKWYGGVTEIARLNSLGLTVNGSVDSKVPTFFIVDNTQISTYQNLPANVVTKIQMVTTTRYNKGVQSGWRNGTYDYVIPKTGLWQFHVSIGLTNFIGNNNIMFSIDVNGELPPDRISTQATINAQFPNQYSTVQGTFHLLLNANDIISLKFNPTIACYTAGLDWNCISKLSGQLIAAS
ncbi:hypothetical protein DFJ77DRAFT_443512 [Powellomyces hirtus]|nr:hypothetical protein DFJ77DRAFT_443512 [Powellomyces hirtus]